MQGNSHDSFLFILQNDSIPGLMYGISGVLMFISASLCLTFPDTKDQILQDTYETTLRTNKVGAAELLNGTVEIKITENKELVDKQIESNKL